jgi:integrase
MRVPSYRHHKGTGQAVVVIRRKSFYLGRYGTPESRQKYERIIGQYLAAGRDVPLKSAPRAALSIRQLSAAYLDYCGTYYRRADGKPTSEYGSIKSLLSKVNAVVGDLTASQLSPSVVEILRTKWVNDDKNSRKYINKQTGRLVRMYRWAVAKEMVEPEVWQRLKSILPLKKGRTTAVDYPKVSPAPTDDVSAALDKMPDDLAAMCRIQLLTGMRPGELWELRPADIDRTGDVWRYTPVHHKSAHHDNRRVIFLGPQSKLLLTPYLLREDTSRCFVRSSGKPWDRSSYRNAIHAACDLAGVPHWNAYQLRHNCGTDVRSQFGLDGSQAILGHAHASTSEIYAELGDGKAAEIARQIG